MSEMQINLGDAALIVTWLELRAAFAALHMNEPAEVSRLHDIWRQSVISPEWNVEPGKVYDERKPRPHENFKCIVSPVPLANWVCEVSKKRGFPYTIKQSLNIVLGIPDYGF